MATAQTLISAPPVRLLPLSKSRDLHVVFIYKKINVDSSGVPIKTNGKYTYNVTNVPAGTVKLEIDDDETLVFNAVVEGSTITVHADHTLTDGILKGRLWRLVITYTNGVDDVLVNGTTIRSDGGR